jgi:hypothetical protein
MFMEGPIGGREESVGAGRPLERMVRRVILSDVSDATDRAYPPFRPGQFCRTPPGKCLAPRGAWFWSGAPFLFDLGSGWRLVASETTHAELLQPSTGHSKKWGFLGGGACGGLF